MKLTKTLLAAAALVAFAVPMSASAQVTLGDVVGEFSGSGDVVVLRNGNYLQLQNGSAFMANDTVFARNGSGTISLTGCNGKFQPCSAAITSGMKVNIGTGDVCSNLGNMIRIGARDAALTAGQQIVPSSVGSVGGGSIGGGSVGGGSIGGGIGGLPLAAIGAVIAGGVAIAIIASDDDDDDDDVVDVPASN